MLLMIHLYSIIKDFNFENNTNFGLVFILIIYLHGRNKRTSSHNNILRKARHDTMYRNIKLRNATL